MFSVCVVLLFPEGHKVGTVEYVAFPTGFFHLAICICGSFLVPIACQPFPLAEWSPVTWTIHSSPLEGYLGCFQILKIMNKLDKTCTGEILFRLSFQFIWANTK